jgi:Ca-activated chloride channel family protein
MERRLFLSALAGAALAQDAEPIRVTVNLVNVPFTVADASGRLVSDLGIDDFEVFEDGQAQKVRFFSRASESPLTLAVLADVSGSQDDYLKEHRKHLKDFLKTVLKPQDKAMLLCFGANVYEVSTPNAQPERLDEALKDFQKAKNVSAYRKLGPREIRDNASSFYDATTESALALRDLEGRRAIILFSDGEDNSSARNLLDAIETAQEHSVTVFCLRYTELKKGGVWSARNKYGRSVMQRIAQETGGLEFDAALEDDLKSAFRQISESLRNSYDLAYTSTQQERDSTFRKIRIRPKNPNLRVRHKTGYFARPS